MDFKILEKEMAQDTLRGNLEELSYVIKRIQYCKSKYQENGKMKFLEWCAFLYQEEKRLKGVLKIK